MVKPRPSIVSRMRASASSQNEALAPQPLDEYGLAVDVVGASEQTTSSAPSLGQRPEANCKIDVGRDQIDPLRAE